jgi:glycoprotein endo-alpha-1,2-mannosidase
MRALVICLVLLCVPATAAASPNVSAFYYPWYGTSAHDGSFQHWTQAGHIPPNDIASNFYPARGVYSSGDPAVIASQMDEMEDAGITEVVVSWWGRGSEEDRRLPAVIAAARRDGLAVAAHLEPYDGRSVASVVDDVAYLRRLGIRTFYVYRPLDFPAVDWAPAIENLVGVQVFAQTALVGAAAAGHFAGVYTYDILVYGGDKFARLCSEAHAKHLLCLPSVGPGYDAQRAVLDARVKPRRNGATYDAMWKAALTAKADAVTITSFNEWHEGTQIEPAASLRRRGAYGYATYDGAWGRHGAAAESAYVDRTAWWVGRFALLRDFGSVRPA